MSITLNNWQWQYEPEESGWVIGHYVGGEEYFIYDDATYQSEIEAKTAANVLNAIGGTYDHDTTGCYN
jgi:hypothetical protein